MALGFSALPRMGLSGCEALSTSHYSQVFRVSALSTLSSCSLRASAGRSLSLTFPIWTGRS